MTFWPLPMSVRRVLVGVITLNVGALVYGDRAWIVERLGLPLVSFSLGDLHRLWTWPWILPMGTGGGLSTLLSLAFLTGALVLFCERFGPRAFAASLVWVPPLVALAAFPLDALIAERAGDAYLGIHRRFHPTGHEPWWMYGPACYTLVLFTSVLWHQASELPRLHPTLRRTTALFALFVGTTLWGFYASTNLWIACQWLSIAVGVCFAEQSQGTLTHSVKTLLRTVKALPRETVELIRNAVPRVAAPARPATEALVSTGATRSSSSPSAAPHGNASVDAGGEAETSSEGLSCAVCAAPLENGYLHCARCGALQAATTSLHVGEEDAKAISRAQRILAGTAVLSLLTGLFRYSALSDAPDTFLRVAELLAHVILAVTMTALALWSRKQPLGALITASCVYAAVQAARIVAVPVVNPGALVPTFAVATGLFSGVAAVMRARRRARIFKPKCSVKPTWNASFCHGCGVAIPRGARSAEEAVRAAHGHGANPEWRALAFVAGAFAMLTALILLAPNVDTGLSEPMQLLSLQLLYACALFPFADLGSLSSAFRFARLDSRALAMLLVSAAFVWLALDPYFALLLRTGIPISSLSDSFARAGWSFTGVIVIGALMPALIEETVFRGLIYGRLRRLMTAWEALLVQAALFSVLHFAVLSFPSHCLMGLVFGLLRERTRSLYPGMLLHAAWNSWVSWQEVSG